MFSPTGRVAVMSFATPAVRPWDADFSGELTPRAPQRVEPRPPQLPPARPRAARATMRQAHPEEHQREGGHRPPRRLEGSRRRVGTLQPPSYGDLETAYLRTREPRSACPAAHLFRHLGRGFASADREPRYLRPPNGGHHRHEVVPLVVYSGGIYTCKSNWVQIYFADGILGILRMKDETKGP
jgi:hypothetical protein